MKKSTILKKLKSLGKRFGFRLIDANSSSELLDNFLNKIKQNDQEKKHLESTFMTYVAQHSDKSKAQLYQDLFVLLMTDEKKSGYFVEFGATNGEWLSNSYLLEKAFDWNGILAEPGRDWHDDLRKNRHCTIDTRCVWTESGKQLLFNQVKDGEFSTVEAFSSSDKHAETRQNGIRYTVDSISLLDLLQSHSAPHRIDYLSVDTEGSELTILGHFDFSKYDIRIITVEHNFSAARDEIFTLLKERGYTRVLKDFSKWDDWYIKSDADILKLRNKTKKGVCL